ncbi:hypothetical protein ACLOJK_001494 [Asimina triloba]
MAMCSDAYSVGITFVENAVPKGAGEFDTLIDGLEIGDGGAWCNNATTCLARRDTRLGSSKKMTTQYTFSGILSNKASFNPDFYNWNKVKVRYCDGSSYTGDVEQVDPATKLYYRGARIFHAVVEDLLAKGMANAENVLLGGCSAGGHAVILQCDNFRSLVPMKAKVKCFADAGYFIDAKTVSGTEHIKAFYDQVVTTHCFFPQYMVQQVKTPLFILNAAYDSWQTALAGPTSAGAHTNTRQRVAAVNLAKKRQNGAVKAMEGTTGTAKPSHSSDSNTTTAGDGASKYLANLPSRGLFSSTVFSSNPLLCREEYGYIYAIMTQLPQRTEVLFINFYLSLTLKKQKNDCSSKDLKAKTTAESTKGKRSAERTTDGKTSAKRANLAAGSVLELLDSPHYVAFAPSWGCMDISMHPAVLNHDPTMYDDDDDDHHGYGSSVSPSKLQGLTVERLRSLLKERGLSTKGKKDELIARLKDDRDSTLSTRKDHEGGEDDRNT